MINKVYALLKTIAPTQYIKRPSQFPSLTYTFLNINPNEFAEDELIETNYYMQIDIWETNGSNLGILGKQIKNVLKTNGWEWEQEFDDYDNETQIYRKVMRFNFLESEE